MLEGVCPEGFTAHHGVVLKPDFVVVDTVGRSVTILDVAITFEDGHNNSFRTCRQYKKTKYQPLKDWYEAQHPGWTVTVDAVVYGSLGSVDAANGPVYSQLGLLRSYVNKMENFAAVDCVRWSRRIWGAFRAGSSRRGVA